MMVMTWIDAIEAVSPQPIGIYPLPAGYLLLPATSETGAAEALAALLRGERPTLWPTAWRFYQLALEGDIGGAASHLGDGPLADYNRFVLQGDHAAYQTLRARLTGVLGAMLESAAFSMGLSDQVSEGEGLTGELRAHVLMVQASAALEAGETAGAVRLLGHAVDAAATSPLFQAQLMLARAEAWRQVAGVDGDVIGLYRHAQRLLGDAPLADLQAHIRLSLATALHERGELVDAARVYQDTLRFVTRDSDPQTYALCQNNIGLAYLSMGMREASDQLRSAVAISAFREALTVYTRETHPHEWSSAQLNLANALQYLPSSHPADNLAEAVGLYQDLYAVRDPARDPLGYARLLANQGNALAHLGARSEARTRLSEAQALFRAHGEPAAADAIDETLKELA